MSREFTGNSRVNFETAEYLRSDLRPIWRWFSVNYIEAVQTYGRSKALHCEARELHHIAQSTRPGRLDRALCWWVP